MRTTDLLADENPEALTLDGFEAALVGYGRRCGQPSIAVYDYDKCIEVLMLQGMDYDAAVEHFEFNVVGAWMGEHTPMILVSEEEPPARHTSRLRDAFQAALAVEVVPDQLYERLTPHFPAREIRSALLTLIEQGTVVFTLERTLKWVG